MACHLFLSLVKKVLGEHVLLLCHWHLGCLGRASWLATSTMAASIRLDRLLWNHGALLSTEAQNGRKSQTRRQKKTQGSVRSVLKLSHIFNHYMFMLNNIGTNLLSTNRYPLPPHYLPTNLINSRKWDIHHLSCQVFISVGPLGQLFLILSMNNCTDFFNFRNQRTSYSGFFKPLKELAILMKQPVNPSSFVERYLISNFIEYHRYI
jgi:hypothetical protein